MILNKEIGTKIAKSLLEIEAVKLNVSNPFTWASGIKSPIYCDNRRILSFPETRKLVSSSIAGLFVQEYGKPDCIAGVATGGIPHGVLAAEQVNLPFVYVRSGKKQHGLGNSVEGFVKPGWKVMVVEDLISTGQSSLAAVESLRQNNCVVIGMIAIFTYGFDMAESNFWEAGCKLITLTDYNILIEVASELGYINAGEIDLLEKWRKDPRSWK